MSQPVAEASDPPTIKVRGPHGPPGRALSDLTIPLVPPGFLAFPKHPCSLADAEGLLRGGRAERGSEREGCRHLGFLSTKSMEPF